MYVRYRDGTCKLISYIHLGTSTTTSRLNFWCPSSCFDWGLSYSCFVGYIVTLCRVLIYKGAFSSALENNFVKACHMDMWTCDAAGKGKRIAWHALRCTRHVSNFWENYYHPTLELSQGGPSLNTCICSPLSYAHYKCSPQKDVFLSHSFWKHDTLFLLGTSFRSNFRVCIFLIGSVSPGWSFHLCLLLVTLLRFLGFGLRRFKGSDGQGHSLTWFSSEMSKLQWFMSTREASNYINEIISMKFGFHNSIQDTTKELTCIVAHVWNINSMYIFES